MKTTVIIYTALVLVGTAEAISVQQPRVNNVELYSHHHLKSNNAFVGDCLENAGIFDTYGYEISYVCEKSPFGGGNIIERSIDLNGDSILESTNGYLLSYNYPGSSLNIPWTMFKAFSPTVISELVLIDVSQIDFENNATYSTADMGGLIDMNNDGLLDAIICLSDKNYNPSYYCVLNISTPPAVACASDVNGNGSVEVNDVIQVISDWGSCE